MARAPIETEIRRVEPIPWRLVAAAVVGVLLVALVAARFLVPGQAAEDEALTERLRAARMTPERLADIVDEAGCERALPSLQVLADRNGARAASTQLLGVCQARAGRWTQARSTLRVAVRRRGVDETPARANLAAVEDHLTALEYVRALELAPEPRPPRLTTRPCDDLSPERGDCNQGGRPGL